MKKMICLFIVAIMLTLCSCASNENTEYSIDSYDEESKIIISTDDQQKTGEFIVKEKIFEYEGNNLVVLNVTNNSKQNYSLTIKGTYRDESGNVIKTEEKTFEQFSAGYQNYFCFYPKERFDSFTYELITEEYTGECYAKDIAIKFQELEEGRGYIGDDPQKYPTIFANFTYKSDCEVKVGASVTLILYNEKDEIIALIDYTPYIESGWEFGDDRKTYILYQTTDSNMEWPEEYKGDITAIVCVKNVFDEIPY